MKKRTLFSLLIAFMLLVSGCTSAEDPNKDHVPPNLSPLSKITETTDFATLKSDYLPTEEEALQEIVASLSYYTKGANFSGLGKTVSAEDPTSVVLTTITCADQSFCETSSIGDVCSYAKFNVEKQEYSSIFYHYRGQMNSAEFFAILQTYDGDNVTVKSIGGGMPSWEETANRSDLEQNEDGSYNVVHTEDGSVNLVAVFGKWAEIDLPARFIVEGAIKNCEYDEEKGSYVCKTEIAIPPLNVPDFSRVVSEIEFKVIEKQVVYVKYVLTTTYAYGFSFNYICEDKFFAFGSTEARTPDCLPAA